MLCLAQHPGPKRQAHARAATAAAWLRAVQQDLQKARVHKAAAVRAAASKYR